jgi:hypothetical protein
VEQRLFVVVGNRVAWHPVTGQVVAGWHCRPGTTETFDGLPFLGLQTPYPPADEV